MAPSYIAAIVAVLAIIFPDVPVENLNTTVNTLVVLCVQIFIAFRQVKTGRSTIAGTRPYEE